MEKSKEQAEVIKETVVAAALMLDGVLYTGKNHAVIISDLQERDPHFSLENIVKLTDGFVTNTGRFVDRFEAEEIADKAGQIVEAPHDSEGELEPWKKGVGLDSWDIKDLNYGD